MSAYFVRGDTRQVLAQLPAGSVDLVVTSPPFLALRSYLPEGDPEKALEIGSEPTPGEYIDTLLDITEECDRVLAPHGSLAFELGDTYSGSGGAGGDYADGGLRDGQHAFSGSAAKRARNGITDGGRPPRNRPRDTRSDHAGGERAWTPRPEQGGGRGWPADKSLAMVPELYRVALAYGFNPLTGRTTRPWRVRNVVRWVRPNPPVGALGDKFRPATSDFVMACRTDEAGRRRYFDGDAVRVPFTGHGGTGTGQRKGQNGAKAMDNRPDDLSTWINTHEGAPLLDWWKISTYSYEGAHYATFPPALVEPAIKSMCPLKVCTVCGEPSRRIVMESPSSATGLPGVADRRHGERAGLGATGQQHTEFRQAETIGWTDCGHDAWRPGRVLDPFAGSGTTLAVATGHGRDAVGCDLDRRNVELARDRVGPLLFHEVTAPKLAVILGNPFDVEREAS